MITSLPMLGVDFTSAPTRRKPITVARGTRSGDLLRLDGLDTHGSFAGFERQLAEPGPWLGAFDFPFGLPREFVDSLQLGADIDTVIAELHRRCGTRMGFRALVDAWSNARPTGLSLPHRSTDRATPRVTSTSPLQTRFVPVGFMFFEGLSRLVGAGVTIPCMRNGDERRIAVEGYPRLLAHELIDRRSYKNDASVERCSARKDIVKALEQGRTKLGLQLEVSPPHRQQLISDSSGDHLDAVLCLMQAAWAAGQTRYGLPADIDPVEGWIVGA